MVLTQTKTMDRILEKENGEMDVHRESMLIDVEYMAKKAAYKNVMKCLNGLIDEAEECLKVIKQSRPTNGPDTQQELEYPMRIAANEAKSKFYMKAMKAVMDLFSDECYEAESRKGGI